MFVLILHHMLRYWQQIVGCLQQDTLNMLGHFDGSHQSQIPTGEFLFEGHEYGLIWFVLFYAFVSMLFVQNLTLYDVPLVLSGHKM